MNRNQKICFWTIFAVGLIQGIHFGLTSTLMPDQYQLMRKAYALAYLGEWTHYGNLSSGGMGNIPGSLTTALVGVPLLIWRHPWAILVGVQAFHVASFFILQRTVAKLFTIPWQLVTLAVFWCSPWRAHESILWNPAYLIFPAIIHMATTLNSHDRPRFWQTFWHVIAIAFAAQLHNSVIILVACSGLVWLLGRFKVHWGGAISAIVVTVVSLIPYFLALSTNTEISPVIRNSDSYLFRGILEVGPFFKGISYWPRFTSFMLHRPIFRWMVFHWAGDHASIVQVIWSIFKWPLAISTLLLSGWMFVRQIKSSWNLKEASALNTYLGAMILSTALSSAASPITLLYWHLVLIYPSAVMSFCSQLQSVAHRFPVRPTALAALLFVCTIVYNGVAASGSQKNAGGHLPIGQALEGSEEQLKRFYTVPIRDHHDPIQLFYDAMAIRSRK